MDGTKLNLGKYKKPFTFYVLELYRSNIEPFTEMWLKNLLKNTKVSRHATSNIA